MGAVLGALSQRSWVQRGRDRRCARGDVARGFPQRARLGPRRGPLARAPPHADVDRRRSGAARPLCFLAPGKPAIAVSCVALWAWKAPQSGIADAIALTWLRERRGSYGSVRLWLSLGFAVFVVVWGGLYQVSSARYAPLVYAAMLAIVAVSSTGLIPAGPALLAPISHSPVGNSRRRSLLTLAAFLVEPLPAAGRVLRRGELLRSPDRPARGRRPPRRGRQRPPGGRRGPGDGLDEQAVEPPAVDRPVRRRVRHLDVGLRRVGRDLERGGGDCDQPPRGRRVRLHRGGDRGDRRRARPPPASRDGQTAARAIGGGLAPVAGLVAGGALYGAVGPGAMFAATAASAGLAAVAAMVALLRTSG